MNIQGISFNFINYCPQIVKNKEDSSRVVHYNPIKMPPALNCDLISFSGVSNGGDILKKLCAYGVPDMYTGLQLLDPKIVEKMNANGVFEKPINKVVKILSNYENTMLPNNRKIFEIIKNVSKKHPNITLSEAFKGIYPHHKKELLRAQQYIFEKIIRLACDLPKDLYEEFSELMNITNKRLLNEAVILPFSEREFLYKLRRIGEEMQTKNNKKELHSVKRLISIANKIFCNEPKGQKSFGRNIKKKLIHQMKPEILKRNSSNISEFKKIFDASPLRNNKDIINLIDNTSAKIHGFPSFANFERKSFIHELKKITRKLKNKKFAEEFTKTSLELPTSKDNISAFIVKFYNSDNSKIGTNIIASGTCSIDHIIAKKNGGANKLANYGLCSNEINRQKTDIYFEDWVKTHPETKNNCQKYVNRLIELYKQGIFEKVSKKTKTKKLDKSYIENFAQTIYDISPKERRIKLDISKLYE